jgi:hypothetical protein
LYVWIAALFSANAVTSSQPEEQVIASLKSVWIRALFEEADLQSDRAGNFHWPVLHQWQPDTYPLGWS